MIAGQRSNGSRLAQHFSACQTKSAAAHSVERNPMNRPPRARLLAAGQRLLNTRIEPNRASSGSQEQRNGGPGESRTPDQRFRNWAIIPQRPCFQCLQFGQFRAVLGLFGSGTCNKSCNDGSGWPSLLISQLISHDREGAASRRQVNSSHSEIGSDNPCSQHL